MNKLEKMLEKLCPDGVEYKKIGEAVEYEQPTKYIVKSTDYDDAFDTPVLTAGQSFILGYTNETDGIYEASKENPVIIFDDFTGAFKWVDFPFKVKSSAMKMLTANESVASLRYIYHSMGFLNFSSAEHKRLWIGIYSEFEIPVPPLEVQSEIVRTLDNFTELTAELTDKLTAELTARKKQYEYYRDELLTSDNSTHQYRLGEICDIYLGLTATPTYTDSGVKFISAQNTSGDYLDLENVKYISRQDFEKATSNAKPKKGDLLFTRVGSNLGHPVIVDTDEDLCIFVSLGFLRVKDKQTVLTPFLKYWMNTDMFWSQVRKNVHGAAKVNLNTGWLKDFEIAIPSLEEQQCIVNILDRFDKLCNDISEGLPAEIDARQKQYEYYRDKLLTFKEKVV